ncbi:hypothetical protein CARUB_v10012617mg [Capsella rubella]|uniref:Uncharacterized protein n=1 Tax=Capsella rubella TaxID=81985 RepID=R0ILJ9_9BRAS|nr:uncharacterized protein LOC17897244 [Capsella rubella]EOA39445.1 hypothetical protein CARUB_v10012617mg [Capsella rubella]
MENHHHRLSSTKSDGVEASDGVGQGKLYSPDHAIKIATKRYENVEQGKLYSPDHAIKISEKPNPENTVESSDSEEGEKQSKTMVLLGMKNLASVKDKVLEKLAAASVPSESLENTKQFLEGVIKDFAGAAQGMTKDALHRIKTHLTVILPSVSPDVTGKIVDDAEKEAIKGEEEDERKSKDSSGDEVTGKLPYVSPASSFFGSLAKPFSKL